MEFHRGRQRLLADIFKDVGTIIFTAVVIGNFVPDFKDKIDLVRIGWGIGVVVIFWLASYFCRPETGGKDG